MCLFSRGSKPSRELVSILILVAVLSWAGCGSPSASTKTQTPTDGLLEPGTVSASKHPLVAVYSVGIRTSGQVRVEFGPTTSYGRTTGAQAVTSGGTASLLVAGMKASTAYHMRARVDFDDGKTMYDTDHLFTTGALPQVSFPTVTVTPSGYSKNGGVDIVSSLNSSALVSGEVLDTDGSILWYYYDAASPLAFPLRLLDNGNFLVNLEGEVREVDLEGNILRSITLSQLNTALANAGYSFQALVFHHDLMRLPNGHWLVLVDENKDFQDLPGYPGTTTVLGDDVIELDANNRPVWVWRAFDHLDVNRHPYGFPDWTHANALVLTSDGNLLISMRHQFWVLKINYANGAGNGDVLWRLGPGGDFTLGNSDPAEWFYAQHFPVLLPSSGGLTRLILFDNGDARPDQNGQSCEISSTCYSRAVILDVDESKLTANIEWEYRPGWYSFWGGSVEVLGDGSVEMTSSTVNGGTARSIEVTSASTPQITWQLDTSDSDFYRAYRVPSLYPGVSW